MRWCAVVLLWSLPAGAFDLQKGPYLQRVHPGGVTVVFETGDDVSGHVRFGLDEQLGPQTAATPLGRHHEVRLEGLQPATRYFYAVYEGDAPRTDTFAFRTAPAAPQAFRFLVYGDNRSDHEGHRRVVDAMMAEPEIDFAVNTGDMVSSGEREEEWGPFFDIERELLARTPFWPTIGNHEEDDGEVPIYERLFVLPEDEHYYAFTYGNARFVVVDGHVEVEPWFLCLLQLKVFDDCFTAAQEAWVRQELAAARQDPAIDHTFVVTHVGPYSSKGGRTGSAQMRWLMPAFLDGQVTLVVSGHDHYYQHGLSENGIHYVVSGGGGAPLYEVGAGLLNLLIPHQPITSESVHHYVVVDVDGETVTVTARRLDGAVLEQFVVEERPACQVAADCAGGVPGACDGQWACAADDTCQWVCNPPPPCLSVDDCPEDAPEGACMGEWRCELLVCSFFCEGGECTEDAECAGRDALNDCGEGRWQCADDVCEWFCPPQGDPPDLGGLDAPDAAVAPDPDAAIAADPDGASDGTTTDGARAPRADEGVALADAGRVPEAVLAEAGLPGASETSELADGGCDCRAGGAERVPAFFLLLGLRRRRR